MHPSEQQLAVGGVSAEVHLFRIGGDILSDAQAGPSAQDTHTKEVAFEPLPSHSGAETWSWFESVLGFECGKGLST